MSNTCNCNTCHNPCDQCCCSSYSSGCPIQLDFSCVIYHKSNSEVTELDGLALSNGATLELVIESLDEKIKQLKVLDFTLPCLRASYVVNTFQQFAQAVDTELCLLSTDVDTALANSNTSLTANDSDTIDFTTSGTLNHTLTGVVKISATADNTLTALSDGLFAAPQTISINYTDKEITISNGNTVSLSGLFVNGWLGNLVNDPGAPEDGQYWFNTTSSLLKIRVNSLTKTITTT